jgi:RIO kinase 1
MKDDAYIDRYEYFEALFDPSWVDPIGQQRKRKTNHKPKRTRSQIVADLADDTTDVELGFNTTYQPSRYEEGWLLSSLYPFYDEGLITDVLALVKGGKEASVYLCQAHPATGRALLAAKVYRPRMFRNLRNDKMYRQGREILVAGGRPAGRDSGYIERAIRTKSAFGLQAAHTSWLMYEFTALERLHKAGGAVPWPVAASDNAILMSYHGDEVMAAPTLNTIQLEPDEAKTLFREVLRNVELMLKHDLVHGDLSAYNILYWEGEITLIDFPQVVNLHTNHKARFLLERDVQRTCDYFSRQGVNCEPQTIVNGLWRRCVGEPDPQDVAADWSRLESILAELDGKVKD